MMLHRSQYRRHTREPALRSGIGSGSVDDPWPIGQEVSVTTIKKVLCAIDLTKASRNAFDRALSIARVSKAGR